MPRLRVLLACFALSVLVAPTGCGETSKEAKLGESCATTDDCGSSLACAEAKCTSVCVTTVDCEGLGGGLCVLTPSGERICKVPTETTCTRNSDCLGSRVCAGDGQCRDTCAEAKQCLNGDVCLEGVCAPAGTKLPEPAGKQCIRKSDCTGTEICLSGLCTKE